MDREVVVREACAIVDDDGAEALTVARVAERLGVRAPSIYKHVDGLPALRRGVMIAAKRELAVALGLAAAGLARGDAVRALAHAYRSWALQHPGRYVSTVRAPAAADANDIAVSEALLVIVGSALRGFALGDADQTDAIRFVRAALHGFVILETSGAFALPADIERSFDRTVDSVIVALDRWAATGNT